MVAALEVWGLGVRVWGVGFRVGLHGGLGIEGLGLGRLGFQSSGLSPETHAGQQIVFLFKSYFRITKAVVLIQFRGGFHN